MSTPQVPLKKKDVMAAIAFEPMTMNELLLKLKGFSFIQSYLTYLLDVFVADGRVARLDDDRIHKIVTTRSPALDKFMYKVITSETGDFELRKIRPVDLQRTYAEMLEDEWSRTSNAAINLAKKTSFRTYKAMVQDIDSWLEVPESDIKEAQPNPDISEMVI